MARPWGLRPQTPTRFLKKAGQKLNFLGFIAKFWG